jgi:hypothetical protein
MWTPAPTARRPPDAAIIGIILVVALLGVFGVFMMAFLTPFAAFSFAPFLCVPVLFIVLIFIIVFAQGANRRRIPPPPPIQQPMVPAGQQGPVALSCPNCGGPPTNVDRFGIATCSYCGTRFLVR